MISYWVPEKATHRAWRYFIGQWPKEQAITCVEMKQRINNAMLDQPVSANLGVATLFKN